MTNWPSDPEFDPDGTCFAARDWLGNRFVVGERVMYCVGAGRGQLMAIGKVLKIVPEGRGIKVQVLTERTSGAWGNGARSRSAWVNPLNVTALPCPG